MGNAPPERSFEQMVPIRGGEYDVIALGLQEATWSVKKTKEESETSAEAQCVRQLLAAVKDILDDDFFMVAHNKRGQMQQLVYGRQSMKSRISKVEKIAENTGFFHVFPNKGGLRVSMMVDSTNIAFISCHLTAHEGADKCSMRNSSVEEILGGVMTTNDMHHILFMGDMNYRCTFDKKTPADLVIEKQRRASDTGKVEVAAKAPTKSGPASNASASDVDLDSIVDEDDIEEPMPQADKMKREMEMQQIYGMITEENWDALIDLDELTRELKDERVLVGYTAYKPEFPPTFKRIRCKAISRLNERIEETPLGNAAEKATANAPTKTFDLDMEGGEESLTSSFYDKKRLPSYTDRILSTSLPAFKGKLTCDSFTSCEDVITSDHKPVIGKFTLQTTRGLHDIMAYSLSNTNHFELHYTTNTQFRLKNLSARNLSEMDSQLFGGGSDPYLVLSADPADILIPSSNGKLKTKAITHDLNPKWTDNIDFRLATNDIAGLSRNAHFFLTVWDYDVTNEDDLIGTAVIPLGDVFQHYADTCGKDYHFSMNLIQHGLIQGQVEGDIEVSSSSREVVGRKHKNITLYEDLANKRENAAMDPNSAGCGCIVS
eukprot:CAMPEP_0185026172 /NCGR_PEP_ID=MMETSP1103-20130426/10132_1 /TAXON_ID=36769 /ORGANISM="Paraphysomonas bandaiensis, Strain Caron Lab Isolate" /LENGTH=602 /DNA_ID=CAMNT_0027559665 /DNA_START=90 /DNA_END=1898 /DNA_ORIENTATION=-